MPPNDIDRGRSLLSKASGANDNTTSTGLRRFIVGVGVVILLAAGFGLYSFEVKILSPDLEWTNFSPKMQRDIKADVFIKFPIIFKKNISKKWDMIRDYLYDNYMIKHNNIRDLFRKHGSVWPRFLGAAMDLRLEIRHKIKFANDIELRRRWGIAPAQGGRRVAQWLMMIRPYIVENLGKERAGDFVKEFMAP